MEAAQVGLGGPGQVGAGVCLALRLWWKGGRAAEAVSRGPRGVGGKAAPTAPALRLPRAGSGLNGRWLGGGGFLPGALFCGKPGSSFEVVA